MKSSRAVLGVTERDRHASIRRLAGTCDRFSVPAKEREEVLAALGAAREGHRRKILGA